MTKQYTIIVAAIFTATTCFGAQEAPRQDSVQEKTISVSVAPTKFEKIKLLLGLMGNCSQELLEVAAQIKKDLEFTGQFTVVVRTVTDMHAKKEVTQLSEQGYLFALFMDGEKNGAIDWRVYDTAQALMLKGEKYTKRGDLVRGWAHNIADNVWKVLAGQEGFFSTKIAYCKEIKQPKKRAVKHVYVADYDGSNEQVLVNAPTINIAPRWNHDKQNPLLFYSDYTNENVRLIAVNMKKQRKIASNFDGINMLPSFSADGKRVVYCLSKGKGSCQLYLYENGKMNQLTNNAGNNVSPCFAHRDSRIVFCSDYQTGFPQIYSYDFGSKEIDRITDGGYCASPSYCAKNDCVVYSKKINGVMQLVQYNMRTQEHVQLTADAGHKEESAWSACGNFILYSVEERGKSRIALLNLLTKEQRFITPSHASCTYPAWSPLYEQFITIS